MQLTELLIIFSLPLVAWFWIDSTKVIESARTVAAKMCKNSNVQFLDDSVHQIKFSFGKNSHGQIKFVRKYEFEFTNNEHQRYKGELVFAGSQLLSSQMDAYRIISTENIM